MGLRRAPAFIPTVTSGNPVLLSAQVPPWKKESHAEASQQYPSYWTGHCGEQVAHQHHHTIFGSFQIPAFHHQTLPPVDKHWSENLGLLLGLTLMSSAQASFCLEFPDMYSLTQPNKTLTGVALYLRKDGGQSHILGLGKVAWSQARSKYIGQRESRQLPATAQKHLHLPLRGCWVPGGERARLCTGCSKDRDWLYPGARLQVPSRAKEDTVSR